MERDAAVIAALERVVEQHPRSRFWKCFGRLQREGHGWNYKRVHRVYCALRLNLPRRTKQRLPGRPRQPLEAPSGPAISQGPSLVPIESLIWS